MIFRYHKMHNGNDVVHELDVVATEFVAGRFRASVAVSAAFVDDSVQLRNGNGYGARIPSA